MRVQSVEGRRLRAVGCLCLISRWLGAGRGGCYIYDGAGVNQLALPGPSPDI